MAKIQTGSGIKIFEDSRIENKTIKAFLCCCFALRNLCSRTKWPLKNFLVLILGEMALFAKTSPRIKTL
jgi:hypothetical protein